MTVAAVSSGTIARPGSTPDLNIFVSAPPWLRPGGAAVVCVGQYDIFFPEAYDLRFRDEIREARALCATCPVRDLCLAWAVARPDLEGIWAGTTPPERRRIRTGRAPREKETV